MTTLFRSRSSFAVSIALAVGLASPAFAGDLSADVKKTLGAAKVGQSRIGISIVDVSNGAALVSIKDDETFIPASNMKVLSSGAALLTLGADYHFKTTFALEGNQQTTREANRETTRLIITGSGDPALADPDVLRAMEPAMTVDAVLAGIVGAVTKSGVTTIKEIVLDDRVFDREYVHPSWSTHHLLAAYGSEICGLNFHHNIIRYFPKPSPQGPGSAPILNIEPAAPWLNIINKAETVAETRNTLWMHRPFTTNDITVQGQIGGKQNIEKNVTIHDGATFLGRLLADRLSTAGVRIDGPTPTEPNVRLATPDELFTPTKTLAIISTPITDVLYHCNTHSDNLYAESLLKATGHAITKEPGSWANGTTVVRMLLSEKIGPQAASSTTIIDGSGLSRDNAVSPATFTSWLRVLANSSSGPVFVASLAKPGEDGTLEKRFKGPGKLTCSVAAKSGMLNQVRSLSGYVTHPTTGKRLAFSILANNVTGDADSAVLKLHEDVVKLADQWLVEQATMTTRVLEPR